jgi:iron complex outermembrane recepter protein
MRQEQDKVRAAVAAVLALASGCAVVSTAHAQEAQTEDQSGQAVFQVEEIIVTAERREETVQKSSLAISVLAPSDLKNGGVVQVADLGNVVPGLTISNAGGIAQAYVRGVGTFSTDARVESSIAFSINGVNIARPAGIGPLFFDLERVEVVKGPQGTLYGRNASGGAINIITKKPTPEFEANVLLEGGNYQRVNGTGVVNLPLGDTFALRAAGQASNRDGYLSDGYEDEDSQSGRLMGLWTPTSAFSMLFTGEYVNIGGQGAAAVPRSTLNPAIMNADPYQGPSDALQPPTGLIPGGTRILNDGMQDTDIAAASIEMNWNLGFGTLTFIPAYRDADINYLTYTPGFRFNTAETSEQTSGELRLGNAGERLKWVAGLYYFNDDQTEAYQLNANPIQQNNLTAQLSTESQAVFTQATFSLTDTFRVIAGVRYTDEEKTSNGLSVSVLPVPAQTSLVGNVDFSDTSWKGGFEYDVGDNSMLFFTAATGYKAGGFIPSVPAPNNTFDKEELTAFELGLRNRFLDERLQINFEGFYWEYDNKQERFLGVTQNNTTGLLTLNAGQATLFGLNMDIVWRFSQNDTFKLAAEYLNSEYDQFNYTVYNPTGGTYPVQATGCSISGNAPVPGTPNPVDTTDQLNCSGMPLVRAPEYSGLAAYEHQFFLGSGAKFLTNINAKFATEQFLSPDFIQSGQDDGYVQLGLDLTYLSKSGKWAFSAWGRNLSDEEVYTGGGRYAFSRPVVAGGDPSLFYANISAPRTYGLRLDVNF